MNIFDFIQGFIIGLSLIIAVGPQNLFVIRQGLKKSYVFLVCLICSISDGFLTIIGINLSTYLVNISPFLINILIIISSLWLIGYGINKMKKSFKTNKINFEDENEIFKNVILTTLTLTFLNPHVYLDTVILIGTISLNFQNKIMFGAGVILSSFIFFYSLGYFSKFLSKFILNKNTWFWMDNFFGILLISYGIFFIVAT